MKFLHGEADHSIPVLFIYMYKKSYVTEKEDKPVIAFCGVWFVSTLFAKVLFIGCQAEID